jgi:hypothetical protein
MTQSTSDHRGRSVVDEMRDQIRVTPMPARRQGLVRPGSAIASALPIAVTVAVVVLVVAVALIGFRHGRAQSPSSTTPSSGVQAARQDLTRVLGVLRRPQTRADLDPRLLSGASVPRAFDRAAGAIWGHPELDRSLVRVVDIPGWHAKVAIDPATYRPSTASAQRSEGVDLSMWIGDARTAPPASYVGTGSKPVSARTVREHGVALSDPTRAKAVILVPDGVASLTVQPIRLTPPHIAPGYQQPPAVRPSDFASMTAGVHDNVAPFELKIPIITDPNARSRMTFFFVAEVRATWFDSRGRVIRQTTNELDLPVAVRGTR